MRRLLLSLVIVHSIAAAHAFEWSTHGPIGGEITALVRAPSNPARLYAGSAAGLSRSDDGGITWAMTSDKIKDVSFVAVDPVDGNVIFVATSAYRNSTGEIYKSVDGGGTWSEIDLPPELRPTTIVIDPRNPRTIYVGSYCAPYFKAEPLFHQAAGVYQSIDGGSTWQRLSLGASSTDLCVADLALDPASPDTLYLSRDIGGYSRSDDGGKTWSPRSTNPLPSREVVIDRRDTAKRFGISTNPSHLLASIDSGASWSEITPAGIPRTATVFNALTIDPQSGRLFLGTTTGTYRSGDGGHSWLPLEGNGHEMTGRVVFDFATSSLMIATFTGLYRSDGYPWNEWTDLALGHAATSTVLVTSPSKASTLYAVSPRRVYRTDDFGMSWRTAAPALPAIDNQLLLFGRVRLTADVAGTLYAPVFRGATGEDKLFRLTPGASEWVDISPPRSPTSSRLHIEFVTADPRSPGEIYAGENLEIAHSRDGGTTWELLQLPRDHYPWSLAIDPRDSNVLIANTARGILKSTDRGHTWTMKTDSFFTTSPVVLSAADPSTLYLLTGGKLARSGDGGETWLSYPLPASDSLGSVATDPRDRNTVYLASLNNGVFRTTNGGVTWVSLTQGLPTKTIPSIAVDPAGAFLHASTDRFSVWELPLARSRPIRLR